MCVNLRRNFATGGGKKKINLEPKAVVDFGATERTFDTNRAREKNRFDFFLSWITVNICYIYFI